MNNLFLNQSEKNGKSCGNVSMRIKLIQRFEILRKSPASFFWLHANSCTVESSVKVGFKLNILHYCLFVF